MGRVKFLSISLLGFLFPNAGFPRVERKQWTEQSKQRGGVLQPRCLLLVRTMRAPSAVGIIPPPLSCLGIGFWYMFRPTTKRLFWT